MPLQAVFGHAIESDLEIQDESRGALKQGVVQLAYDSLALGGSAAYLEPLASCSA
jgi:hypothetical protein